MALTMKLVTNDMRKASPMSKNDPRFRIRPVQQMASACTGALLTSLFMTPLDVVKTRLQAQQKALISNKCYLYCNGLMDHLCPCQPNSSLSKKTVHLNGTIDAFIKITRTEGVTALWSGLSPTLVLALPATVIYFVTYEQLKTKNTDLYEKYISGVPGMPSYIPMLSGCSARILAVTIVSPLELIRTKMQSERLSFLEVKQALKITVGTEGITGLWRGLTSTIYRDVPFSGIYWTCYETIKKIFEVTDPTFFFSFLCGAFSGSVAAFITTPFDVVKTHQQIEFGEKVIYTDKPAKNVPTQTTRSLLKKIYAAHGLKGLFAGVGPRLAKVAPACAIMISTFEYSKSFFYTYNIEQYLIENGMSAALSYPKSD